MEITRALLSMFQCPLFLFLVIRVFPAPLAIFLQLQPIRCRPAVLPRRIVPPMAGLTGQRNDLAHCNPLVHCSRFMVHSTYVPGKRVHDCPEKKWPAVFLAFLPVNHHHYHSRILLITPAPTVWPPSRMANRSPSSMAIGFCRVTSNFTLSPGITISTPSASFTTPVTSVVRK